MSAEGCRLIWSISDYFRSSEEHRKLHLFPQQGSCSVRSAPTTPVYQLVTLHLVYGLLHPTTASLACLASCWERREMAGSPASPRSPQVPVRDPSSPVQVECTQRTTGGEAGTASHGPRTLPGQMENEAVVPLGPSCFSKEAPKLQLLCCPRPQPRFGRNQQRDGFVRFTGCHTSHLPRGRNIC